MNIKDLFRFDFIFSNEKRNLMNESSNVRLWFPIENRHTI